MTKTQLLSTQVAELIAKGTDPLEALRRVCGVEVVDAMIASLYQDLRQSVSR